MIIFMTDEPAIAVMGTGNVIELFGPGRSVSSTGTPCLLVLDRRPLESRILLKGSSMASMERVALEIQRLIKAHGDSPNNLVIQMDDVVKAVFK